MLHLTTINVNVLNIFFQIYNIESVGNKRYFFALRLYNESINLAPDTNIPSCRRDESKTSFPLQEGIFVYS